MRIGSDATALGLATAKVTFHVETVPNHPEFHVHADLSLSRFPLAPVTYVPKRGDGPPLATVWLYAPQGFLRQQEPHTLLSAPAVQYFTRGGGAQWRWKPGLAHALAVLTHLKFPTPTEVFAHPSLAAERGAIRAFVLYSEGTKSRPDEQDDESSSAAGRKPTSVRHAAKSGFVPGDHLEVHNQLGEELGLLGIVPVPSKARVRTKTNHLLKLRLEEDTTYILELWTSSVTTRDALLATLEHHHGLTRTDDGHQKGVMSFAGNVKLKVLLRDGATLATGIEHSRCERDDALSRRYVDTVVEYLGHATQTVASILELEDDAYFARVKRIDPKRALKQGFARSGRRLQCLRPAQEVTEPSSRPERSSERRVAPYPGTRFSVSTIHRCAAAIDDALRQLGRLGSYEVPAGLPELEQIGVWLHHGEHTSVPIVIRLDPAGRAIAHLVLANGEGVASVPYEDCPGPSPKGKGGSVGRRRRRSLPPSSPTSWG